jgi:hypothetical protein
MLSDLRLVLRVEVHPGDKHNPSTPPPGCGRCWRRSGASAGPARCQPSAALERLIATEGPADGLPQPLARSLRGVAQCRFEFRESLLDRVEVGTIGRQIDQLCALRGD